MQLKRALKRDLKRNVFSLIALFLLQFKMWILQCYSTKRPLQNSCNAQKEMINYWIFNKRRAGITKHLVRAAALIRINTVFPLHVSKEIPATYLYPRPQEFHCQTFTIRFSIEYHRTSCDRKKIYEALVWRGSTHFLKMSYCTNGGLRLDRRVETCFPSKSGFD